MSQQMPRATARRQCLHTRTHTQHSLSRAPRTQADTRYVLVHAARTVSASPSRKPRRGWRTTCRVPPKSANKEMEAVVKRAEERGGAGAGAGGRAANDQNANPNLPSTPGRGDGDGGTCAAPRTSLPFILLKRFSEVTSQTSQQNVRREFGRVRALFVARGAWRVGPARRTAVASLMLDIA